ncbi:hypothetical protein G4B88_020109 [Cannabis sativa]|uniref:Uncharacterized protein n=1 Tax=Cannabis sativa TaxID=3483 RepID=A0A7J6GLN7_CANSA|nr:hypothetical protein G4B88_020109 [Cannabis sativa]
MDFKGLLNPYLKGRIAEYLRIVVQPKELRWSSKPFTSTGTTQAKGKRQVTVTTSGTPSKQAWFIS